MSKEKKRGIWFFLFGCSPMTLLVLLGVLAGMVLLPGLISVVTRRINPPEPRFYRLPHVREGRSWIMVEGSWRFRVDANDDGVADCFVRVASGREHLSKISRNSPDQERFVRSIKDECLNRMIFFGERTLRKATREYAAHYHRERNHQGIDNRLIEPGNRGELASSAIQCAQRLGGMLRFYHRAAA